MAVKIRLRRVGAKKQPAYRVVIADSRAPRDGRFIEIVGNYNPLTHPATVAIDSERALYWLHHGAQPSDIVRKLFVKQGIWAAFTGEAAPLAVEAPAPVAPVVIAEPEPIVEAAPAEAEAPVAEAAPAEAEAPAEEAAPAAEAAPAEETAPAAEETPAEAETPAEETPAEDDAKAE